MKPGKPFLFSLLDVEISDHERRYYERGDRGFVLLDFSRIG
jgi:hypothetical protein